MVTTHVQRRYRAAEILLDVQATYAERGGNVALAALAGSRNFVEWNHYPAADIRDRETGAVAYYHAHSAEERLKDEHGHFHVFVPRDGKGGRRAGTGYSHLVGISVTARGEALRLFTTNRWVTGEDWLPASRLAKLLEDFRLIATGRLAPVARWLTAMTCIYGADIGALLEERDTIIATRSHSRGREATLEDRSIHIVTEKPVNIPERLLKIDAEFSAR